LNNIVTLKLRLEPRGHSRSLKLVPFKSLGTVSYSPSIVGLTTAVSVAVCEIFILKEWYDLKTGFKVVGNGTVW